jgi:predicted permease
MIAQPPRLAQWLLAGQVRPDDRSMVLGDLNEQFHEHLTASGRFRARLWYWAEAVRLAYGMWRWTPRPSWAASRIIASDDLRYAGRRLRKQPLTSLVSIATLAFAIGAAAATWSLISSVMLHPLQVTDPDRVYAVGYRRTPTATSSSAFNYPTAQVIRNSAPMTLAAWGSINAPTPLLVQTTGEPRSRSVRFTTANFLDLLGLKPALGRYFTDEEDRLGEPFVVVLSERLWRRDFNSDRTVLGRTIQIRDQPARIIGVAPVGFRGLEVRGAPDFFMPLHTIDRVQPHKRLYSDMPPVHWVKLVGRLPDGMTPAQAEGRFNALNVQFPGSTPEMKFVLTDVETAALSDSSRADLRKFATMLGATVALLLIIGSLTVGMLLLMRTEARGTEFALCLALGASRLRLGAGVAIEGLILATAAVVLALPVSQLVFSGISVFQLPGEIRVDLLDLRLDGRVLAGAAAAAAGAVILIAGIASLFAVRRDHGDVLRAQAGATARVTRRRSRMALVTAQVAVTLVLVSGAGLFARSVVRALSLNPGIDTSKVLWGDGPDLIPYGYDQARSAAFLKEFKARLESHPAVASVGFAEAKQGFSVIQVGAQRVKMPSFLGLVGVDDRYMATIGLPVLAGRAFDGGDLGRAPRVAMVSASLAKALSESGNVLGLRVAQPAERGAPPVELSEIVGIVADVRMPGSLQPMKLYLPSTQYSAPVYPGSGGPDIVVRTTGDIDATAAAVRETIQAMDPLVRPAPLSTIDTRILEGMGPQRFGMTVMGALGAIALFLSVLGTYVIAESMAVLRRREMGIRAALGARGSQLGRLLLSDTFRLVGAGLLLGFGLTWLGANTIRAFLFQVEPFDPLVTIGVAAMIVVLALAVSLRPALSAARLDLSKILRED